MQQKRKEKQVQNLKFAVLVCTALVYFAVYAYLSFAGFHPILMGVVLGGAYLATAALLALISRRVFSATGELSAEEEHAVTEFTRDLLVRLSQPVTLCDGSGRIIWHNEPFGALFDGERRFGQELAALCQLDYKKVITSIRPEGVRCAAGERTFSVRAYPVRIEEKQYYVLIFIERTELDLAWGRVAEEETQVAYIVIDNLSELFQYVHEQSRSASAKIESILAGWAESVGGVLKEYERDKFIFFFHKCHLQEFVEEKFDVINRIREVRLGEGSLPVTVSVGVSAVDGSLADKEHAAHAALDMALQRGGDQAAVKYPNEMLFFGGKTKTIQKRTKVRARVFASELLHQMSLSSKVMIMGHARADMDSLGACLGVAKLAKFCGVQPNIVADRTDANTAKFFRKLDSMKGYSDLVIDRAEALELNRSDSLLVVVDVNNRSNFEAPDLFASVSRVAVIDHHIKNDDYETAFSYIEPSASSTCEIVAELLEQALPDGDLTKDEANIILAGILLDTRQFTRNTGSRTFGAAQYLGNQGAVPLDAMNLYQSSFREYEREARFQSKLKMYREHLVIAVNDWTDNQTEDRIIGAKVADRLLELEGVSASFTVCRIGQDVYISARSAGTINVQIIMGYLGGGGSYDSSAAQMAGCELEEGVIRLKNAIDQYYSED